MGEALHLGLILVNVGIIRTFCNVRLMRNDAYKLYIYRKTSNTSRVSNTPCLKKNCANLFFVRTLPNFDRL